MRWGGVTDGDRPTIVGRDAEMALVDSALARLQRGTSQVVVVDGPAGAGKSLLAGAAAARGATRSLRVLTGRGHEIDPDRPLGVLREALAGQSEVPVGGDIAASLLQGRAAPGSYGVQEDMLEALERLAVAGPVLLVLEDLHWADAATLSTVAQVARRLAQVPLGLLLTRRPLPRRADVTVLWDTLTHGGAVQITLDALDEHAVADLAAAILRARPGPGVRRQLARAGGSPLLVVELLHALLEGGDVDRVDGVAELVGDPPTPSLGQVIHRQLRVLDPDALALLGAAAVLGTSFAVDDLAVVTDSLSSALLPRLDGPLAAGLLAEDGNRLMFRHALVRDAVYHDLTRSARRALHLQAGRRLAAAGRKAETVATHFRLGAEPGDTEAAGWLHRAGRAAVASAPVVAEHLLDEALRLLPQGHHARDELIGELGVAQMWAGRPADGEATLRRLLARPHAAEVDAPARLARARALVLLGRTDDAVSLLASASERADLAPRDRALLLAELALADLLVADVDGAAAAADAALAAAEAGGGDVPACVALGARSAVAHLRGDLPEAQRLSLAACRHAAASSDREVSRRPPQLFAGMHAVYGDRFQEGDALLREAREISEEMGGVWDLPLFHWFTAVVRFHAGALDDADTEVEAGLTVAAEGGTAFSAVWAQAVRAHVALHRGDQPGTEAALSAGRAELAERGPLVRGTDWLLWAQARLLERQGDVPAAAALLGAVWDGHAARGIVAERCLLGPDLVRMALAVGDDDRVAAVVAGVDEAARRARCGSASGAALRAAALATADPARATAAVAAYDGSGRRLERALACEDAARLLAQAGDGDTARALLDDALDAYEACGAGHDARRAAATLRSLGVRRGIRGARGRPALGWAALTGTEDEVVSLAVRGLTNREIGRHLFVSPRTVETHLSHVFAKLQVSSRVELAATAAHRPADQAPLAPVREEGGTGD